MTTRSQIPLTQLAHGAGCGCKLSSQELGASLAQLEIPGDERLLVGAATREDAAVVRVTDDLALVQTVDFFTPVVDDPYDFGRIAATNAFSDVYAMGGRPLSAMNVVAWPRDRLDDLPEVLRGGLDVTLAAGALQAGGHSIEDSEPKYGLAVTGVVDPARMLTNAGGRPGDVLVMTKPLGVGAIISARKAGGADDELLAYAVSVMTELNDAASEAALDAGARAATDVTGFGLLGHLHNIARESGVAAVIAADAVPTIPGVDALLAGDAAVSGGTRRNLEFSERFTTWGVAVPQWRRRLLADATTSGGLLVAIHRDRAADLPGQVLGHLMEGEPGSIDVR